MTTTKSGGEIPPDKLQKLALRFLYQQEWSIGNGQCPKCMGLKPDFDDGGDPFFNRVLGHREGCNWKVLIDFMRGKLCG